MLKLHIMSNSLTVILADTHIISATDPRYSQILKLLGKGELKEEEIINIISYKEGKPVEGDERLDVKPLEDKITIDGHEMPEGLKIRFLDLKRRHKPRSYLLKFWDKLQLNPNQNSIKMLYKFLEHNGHPITADGNFIAYKAVTLDMYDHHTKTNKHRVGCVIKMDRDLVDSDPNSTCSTGLHVCSAAYLASFHPEDSVLLEVLVDPKDVVCVPVDYDGTKMRVSRYKVSRKVKNSDIEKRK